MTIVFRAYGDDSLRSDGVKQLPAVCTFAAVVATHDVWSRFERAWNAVMRQHGVPYLHMREFTQSVGPYEKWKSPDREPERRAFLRDCLATVKVAGSINAYSTSVLCDHLERFNRDYKQTLRPYEFCLSAALLNICIGLPHETVTLLCDRLDHPQKRIAEALGYLAHDPRFERSKERICALPLNKDQSSKNVFPMQLADWVAWESRCAADHIAGWVRDNPNEDVEGFSFELIVHYLTWRLRYNQRRAREHGKAVPNGCTWPDTRWSARAVASALELIDRQWDYDALVRTSEARGHRWTR